MSIGALLFGVIGALFLVLRAGRGEPPLIIEFSSGYGPGVVLLEGVSDTGPDPFTSSIAAGIGLDDDLIAFPPLNADVFLSPDRRLSTADRLLADGFGWELAARSERDGMVEVSLVEALAAEYLGPGSGVSDLEDRNDDGRDDDGRFTVRADDGSAVCVSTGPHRVVASALGAAVDPEDRVAVGGVSWDPTGACSNRAPASAGLQIRVGSTPGLYGGVRTGDVCDVPALLDAFEAAPAIGEAWALVHGLPPESLSDFLTTLTPVVLLRDTLVTAYGWQSGRIIPRQSILQRGTAVLIDVRGVPVSRCLSGAPLQIPRGLPPGPAFQGSAWPGFSEDLIDEIPGSERDQDTFLLVDLATGDVIRRTAGASGAPSSLAGPIVEAVHDPAGVDIVESTGGPDGG
jgi:hypothetical protein